MNTKEELIELIRAKSCEESETPKFRLASGLLSRYYFNLKKTTYSSRGQYLIGRAYHEKIQELGLKSRLIGGLTLGADPIATATAFYSYSTDTPINAFVVRKEVKKHGTMLRVEGDLSEGDSVIIIDDVVTTGGSTIKAIELAEDDGLKIEAVIVLLDRCEQSGRQNVEKKGYPFHSILSINDVISA